MGQTATPTACGRLSGSLLRDRDRIARIDDPKIIEIDEAAAVGPHAPWPVWIAGS
jgi:hypothetical protein